MTFALVPPHSGYHMKGRRAGFEGWYKRLTLPEYGESFGFIYSIFDPADEKSSRHGCEAQVVGPDEGYVWRTGSAAKRFWADEHDFRLGHVFDGVAFSRPTPFNAFERFAREGFQLTGHSHQGIIGDARWCYNVRPLMGWGGGASARQFSTAGWLAALPVFEPHYQVLMAHGLASGFVEWQGSRFDFVDAPAYAEKNWGGSFPKQWWWLQCNSFDGQDVLSVTSAGGARGNPLLPGRTEDVALVAVHTAAGEFFPFPDVEWEVAPWGSWRVSGRFEDMRVTIDASCNDDGVRVRCPTQLGMLPYSRETFQGELHIQLWRVTANGDRIVIADQRSRQAALEVGGESKAWTKTWRCSCSVSQLNRRILAANVPLDRVAYLLPGY